MATLDPQEIALFRWADQLPDALWDDLAARPADQAAAAAGALWQDGCYHLTLAGRAYRVDPAGRGVHEAGRPEHRVGFQAGMILVSHLARALGVPPAGRMVTPQELPGGSLFFTGPHAVNTRAIEARFGADPAALVRQAAALGGAASDLGGDVAVQVPGLPHLPLFVLLWAADEEFSARAVVGLDANAHHQLALDGVWALTNLLAARLCAEN